MPAQPALGPRGGKEQEDAARMLEAVELAVFCSASLGVRP